MLLCVQVNAEQRDNDSLLFSLASDRDLQYNPFLNWVFYCQHAKTNVMKGLRTVWSPSSSIWNLWKISPFVLTFVLRSDKLAETLVYWFDFCHSCWVYPLWETVAWWNYLQNFLIDHQWSSSYYYDRFADTHIYDQTLFFLRE